MPSRIIPLGRSIVGGLGFRLVVLLSLALLPIGLIAVAQNNRVVTEAKESADTALLGLTTEAVAGERALIQSGFGSASALGQVAAAQVDNIAECRNLMEEFVRRSRIFSFAGFVELDGALRCSSSSEVMQFGGAEGFKRAIEIPIPLVLMNPEGIATGHSALVVAQPIWDEEVLQGYVLVALPQYALDLVREYGQVYRPTLTVMFNAQGESINSRPRVRDLSASLPAGMTLEELALSGKQVIQDQTEDGRRATFTVIPLISERLFVLGIWTDDDLPSNNAVAGPLSLAFPFLMWVVSLGVAYFAVHRLVIRHIRTLNRQMRRFALGERDDPPEVLERAPAELWDLSCTFNKLTRILARDEAELAASLAEKTVLLKEVHHRVKNNLQLIASIISIQSRRVLEPEARQVLKSLQDRVMALATIHRRLYQSDRLAAVRADLLLGDIVNQMVSMGAMPGSNIEVTTDLEPVTLYPDQIVPMSLLATEGVTNALKYVGRLENGTARIETRLHPVGDDEVLLEVINSIGAPLSATQDGNNGTNLGAQLINAFAGQLEAEIEQGEITNEEGAAYRLAIRFRAAGFVPEQPAEAA